MKKLFTLLIFILMLISPTHRVDTIASDIDMSLGLPNQLSSMGGNRIVLDTNVSGFWTLDTLGDQLHLKASGQHVFPLTSGMWVSPTYTGSENAIVTTVHSTFSEYNQIVFNVNNGENVISEALKPNYTFSFFYNPQSGVHQWQFTTNDGQVFDVAEGELEIYMVVSDALDDEPVITGPAEIYKDPGKVLTHKQIKDLLTATDFVDGDLTSEIIIVSDTYTGQGHVVGTYSIVFGVVNSSEYSSTHEITVKVRSGLGDAIFIDNYNIRVGPSTPLTTQQIVNVLVNTSRIVVNAQTTVHTLYNHYLTNEETLGDYEVRFRVMSTSGADEYVSVLISVYPDLVAEDDIILTPTSMTDKVVQGLSVVGIGLIVIVILGKLSKKRGS